MSEHNYSPSHISNGETESDQDVDSEEVKKNKKRKEEAQKKRKRQEEAAEERKTREVSAEDGAQERSKKKLPVFDEILGITKQSVEDKKRSKKEDGSTVEQSGVESAESSDRTKKRVEEQESAEPEQLAESEAVEAAQAYIAARTSQLQGESDGVSSEEAEPEETVERSERHREANQIHIGFLQALKRSLSQNNTAPNEDMLEASLQEALSESIDEEGGEQAEATTDTDQVKAVERNQGTETDTEPDKPIQSHPASGELRSDEVVQVSPIQPRTDSLDSTINSSPVGLRDEQLASSSNSTPKEAVKMPTQNTSMERTPSGSGAGEFLLGGFIGYLLGKRRGRLKTERELEPVRTSLERQVSDLQQTIQVYEERARSSVLQASSAEVTGHQPEANQANTEPQSSEEVQQTEARKDRVKHSHESDQANIDTAPMQQTEAGPNAAEKVVSQEVAEQSEPLTHTQKKTAEKIANLGLSQETVAHSAEPEELKLPEERAYVLTPERVDTTSTAALLFRAESIYHNNQSLRDLYEQGEISDRVLRKVLKEHLRGNRVDGYLDKELRKNQNTAELYNPETQSNRQHSKLANDHNFSDAKDHHGQELPEVTSSRERSRGPGFQTDTSNSTEKSQSEKMKQATLGAVIGLVFVIFIWITLGLGGLIL